MKPIPDSELIINADGSIYHLNLLPEDIADTIITVGDQERVERVSRLFDTVEVRKGKREFYCHTGTLGGKRLSVVSTGIGTDNIDIVFNELDALANVDFKTRMVKPDFRQLTFIRIGTSGCIKADVPVDSFLFSKYAIGLDGLLPFYNYEPTSDEKQILSGIEGAIPNAYAIKAPTNFVAGSDFIEGITITCTGFYAPQGRYIRLKPRFPKLFEHFKNVQLGSLQCTNFEMETAGIYAMAHLLGHKALSFNALLANRITNDFSNTPTKTVDKLIERVLQMISERKPF